MWVIRRLKSMGASEDNLLKVLRAQVLSVLQFATPAWSTLLTVLEKARIESVLKTGLFLVYGERYQNFNWALNEAQMCTLEEQRTRMLKNFTKHCLKNSKFNKWFRKTEQEDIQGVATRQRKLTYKPVLARTSAYAKSAIPQMVRIANSLKQQNSPTEIVLNSGQTLVI